MTLDPADLLEVTDELRAVARQVVDDRTPTTAVRSLLDDDLGFDPALWSTFAELGWLGLAVPEVDGGAGMPFSVLGAVLEELGRGVVPAPMLASVVLGTGAVATLGSERQRAEWLPPLLSGQRRLTFASVGPSGRLGIEHSAITARRTPEGWTLDGTAAYVPDAAGAHSMVVAALADEGPLLALVSSGADGLTVEAEPTYDQTRRLSTVTFSGVVATDDDVLGTPGHAGPAIGWLEDRAAVALALDSCGGARRIMEVSVAYAKERIQFDRPIGSFQAVKHRCADMFLAVESSRIAAQTAARTLADEPGATTFWPSVAKSYAADAYSDVASAAIVVHGGIGFTWEHDAHLHLKRAKLNQAWFGTSAWHRCRVAALARSEVQPSYTM